MDEEYPDSGPTDPWETSGPGKSAKYGRTSFTRDDIQAAYKQGGDDNIVGIVRAVRGMALRRETAGKREAAQALRELESDIVSLLADRGVQDV